MGREREGSVLWLLASVLLLVAVVSLASTPYIVLMPMISGQVLHGGPNTFGLLMGKADPLPGKAWRKLVGLPCRNAS